MLLGILLLIAIITFGQNVNQKTVKVSSYTKKDGTVVNSYYKTAPNKTNQDNYSTKPNINPKTGNKGYKPKDYSPDAIDYKSGKTIYTGAKGGQYYYNSKGNKVYVPKS